MCVSSGFDFDLARRRSKRVLLHCSAEGATNMAEKQAFIPLTELKTIELRCPDNDCSFSVNVEFSKIPETDFPAKCPLCKARLVDKGLFALVDAWKTLLARAEGAEIYFRIEADKS
jgi:hypothetical protein